MIVKGVPQNRSGKLISDEEPNRNIQLKEQCPLCRGTGQIYKPHGKLWLFSPLDWGPEDIRGERAVCECPYCHKEFKIFKREEVMGEKKTTCNWCRMEYKLKHVREGENKAIILIDAIL